jgi:hypothetical protein
VNYVLGLPDTDDTRALLEQLAPGDEFTMTTRGGTAYTFSFNSRETVPPMPTTSSPRLCRASP